MCNYFTGTVTYDTVSDKYQTGVDEHSVDVGDKNDDRSDDDDDEDDDEEGEHEKSVIDTDSNVVKINPTNQLENVRREATVLVDRVLEESIHIVNETQDRIDEHDVVNGTTHVVTTVGLSSASENINDTVVDNNIRLENNSDSNNYAITCDIVGGLDVIKSPTIESMSGKSFDDNLSSSDDHIVTATNVSLPSQQQQQQWQQQHQVGPQETPSQSGDDMRGTADTVQASQTKGKCSLFASRASNATVLNNTF